MYNFDVNLSIFHIIWNKTFRNNYQNTKNKTIWNYVLNFNFHSSSPRYFIPHLPLHFHFPLILILILPLILTLILIRILIPKQGFRGQ